VTESGITLPSQQSSTRTAKRFAPLLLCLCSLLAAWWCTAAERQFVVYSEPNRTDSWPVETYDTVRVEGLASDLVRTLFSELGYSADIQLLPWSRVMHSVKSEANTFAINMTRTPSREERFHWIGLIRPVSFKLWGLNQRVHEFPTQFEKARNFRIIASRGDVVSEYLESQGFTNLVYTTPTSNTWELLLRNRVDLIPYTKMGIENFLVRNGQPMGAMTPVITIDDISTAHYLVMNKDSDPELVNKFTTAYHNLVDSGIYREILGLPSKP
jgi:polar amino acid transport system substrate-binding protein